ncbi:hypothetical protein GN956_G23303 [Arapaima gigas]
MKTMFLEPSAPRHFRTNQHVVPGQNIYLISAEPVAIRASRLCTDTEPWVTVGHRVEDGRWGDPAALSGSVRKSGGDREELEERRAAVLHSS